MASNISPDEARRELARRELERRRSQPSVTEDVAKSGASGLARGTLDLVGLPGTIGDALDTGLQFGLRKLWQGGSMLAGGDGNEPSPDGGMVERFFAGPKPEVKAQMIGGGSNPFSGDNLRKAASFVTGGATDYQPKTTAGEYTRTGAEFLPAALAGPGGMLRKAAMSTVPAALSETAGQLTEGTAAEPWARAGGALVGGIATAGRVNAAKEAAKGAPTREALKQTTDGFYNTLRAQGIKYDSNAWGATVQGMMNDLLKRGFRPSVAKDAFGFVDDLAKQANHSLDFDDINGLVQTVGGAARSAAARQDHTTAEAFGIIRDKLDDFERAAPLMTTSGATSQQLNAYRSAARQTALKNIKARTLDNVLQDADTYQHGVEAGIRNGIGKLLRSQKGKQLFSGPERTALLEVAQGRKGLRTLSRFGFDLSKFNGNATFIPAVGAIGAGSLVDPMTGAALLAAGTVAKQASPRLTQRAFDETAAAVRSGKLRGASGQEITKRLRTDQTMRRLLAGQMGVTASQPRR